MPLSLIQFTNGLLSFFTTSVGVLIGILILLRYFEHKKPVFLWMGLAWIGIYQPWWSSSFVFLLNIMNIINGGIDPRIYIFIGNIFIPFTAFCWFMGITTLVYPEKRVFLISIIVPITIIMDIIIMIFLTIDYSILGTIVILNANYSIFMAIYLMFVNLCVCLGGIIMGKNIMASEKANLKIRGQFLICASLSYVIGAFMDVGLIDFFPSIVTVSRTILIFGSVFFYLGFFLPSVIKSNTERILNYEKKIINKLLYYYKLL